MVLAQKCLPVLTASGAGGHQAEYSANYAEYAQEGQRHERAMTYVALGDPGQQRKDETPSGHVQYPHESHFQSLHFVLLLPFGQPGFAQVKMVAGHVTAPFRPWGYYSGYL